MNMKLAVTSNAFAQVHIKYSIVSCLDSYVSLRRTKRGGSRIPSWLHRDQDVENYEDWLGSGLRNTVCLLQDIIRPRPLVLLETTTNWG